MTESEIIAERELILTAIQSGNFRLRDHAVRRGDQRDFGTGHVAHLADHLITLDYQPDKFTHRFIGWLDQERTGGFTAVVNEGVWIVTIFRRRLSRAEKSAMESGGGHSRQTGTARSASSGTDGPALG